MTTPSAPRRSAALAGLLLITLWPGTAVTRPAAKPAVQAPAAGVLLVASRNLLSPSFTQSVVLLIRHEERGSLGVILNRRTRITLRDVLPDLDAAEAMRHRLWLGGPVAPETLRLLQRRERAARGIETVFGNITTSTSAAVLEALLARRKSPDDVRFYIGYSGWAAGQLEAEIARGSWHLVPATEEQVFGDDEELWEQLIDRLDPPGIHVWRPGLESLVLRAARGSDRA